MMEILKAIAYVWLGSALFFLIKDSAVSLLEHLKELTVEEIKSKKENLGFVLIGSAFFGLLVGINYGTPEWEILARVIFATIFGIMGLNLIKGE